MVRLSIRSFILAAMLIALGCDIGALRDPSSSRTLLENTHDTSDQSLGLIPLTTETPVANNEPSITVELPTQDQPVTAAMFCQKMSENADSVTLDVWIKLLIARRHYIYAPADAEGPFRTLSVDLQLPSGTIGKGDWQFPSSNAKNGHEVYDGSVVMHRQVRHSKGPVSNLEATVHFQVCNEDVCYPPVKLQLTGLIGRSQ